MAPPPSSTSSSGAPAVHPSLREITEDTPPDLLEGTMELLVILPSLSTTQMTVDRRTPIMDLLIQVGTLNRLNPGDHIVQIRNERGIELPYKPSTPIGALDTTTIEIVPKNRVSEYIIVKKPAKVANQPFEHTFRLQVHLPRNQLYVMRVSMKAVLEDILREVCQEKNLDIRKYEIRHPGNLEEQLPLNGTLGEFGLQEITVVSKNTKINSSVSTADILALQSSSEERRTKIYLDASFKHDRSSVGGSSLSSGSTGSARGVSPTRSDDSRSVSPFPIHSSTKLSYRGNSTTELNRTAPPAVQKAMSMSNMFSPQGGMQPPQRQKKRAAPLPPPLLKSQTMSAIASGKDIPRKKEAPRAPLNTTSSSSQLNQSAISHHSRHSSGSSGCNEIHTQNDGHRYDRQSSAPAMMSRQITTRSTNLTSTSSISNTSLASSTGGSSKKRRAPVPPTVPVLNPQSEIDEEDFSETSSSLSGPVKSDKSGRSSVEVEVEVHYNTNTPISVNTCNKDDDAYSSTPVSSLSSPGSYLSSNSSTSSPMPRTDSPQSNFKPCSSVPNSAKTPQSNFSASSDLHSGVMQPVEDPVAGRTEVPAPLPPPRSKSREIPEAENTSQPQPKPRARPRPDRKSSDNQQEPLLQKRDSGSGEESPQETVLSAAPIRNPLAKYGVKVLPENVLKERADRLAKAASISQEKEESFDKGASKFDQNSASTESRNNTAQRKKAAPTPPEAETQAKPPLPPSSKNSAFRLQKDEGSRLPKLPKKKSITSSLDEDSDDLEENLELFEPVQTKPYKPDSPKSSFSSQSSSAANPSQQIKKAKAPAPPVPVDSRKQDVDKPRVVSSSVSDFQDLERKVSRTLSTDDESALVRTHSDRHQKKGSGTDLEEDGKMINRWQNMESLNEIDDKNGASNRNTNTSSKVEGSGIITATKMFKKRSDSRPSQSEGNALKGHVTEDTEDAALTSSESEVSYTDSGVPNTETITPSPQFLDDSRISDQEDYGESAVKSQLSGSRGSSQRSSLNSDEGHNWRDVINQKNQNIEDAREKAFASMMYDHQPIPSEENTHTEQKPYKLSIDDEQALSEARAVRKVSKSESFSHNAEYETQLKRKIFATGNTKAGSSAERKSSKHSSSEEDLSKSSGSPRKYSQQLSGSESEDKRGSASSSDGPSAVGGKINGDVPSNRIQNSTSMQGATEETSENPELIKAFKSQMEAQFEQWKQEFMEKQGLNEATAERNVSMDSHSRKADEPEAQIVEKEQLIVASQPPSVVNSNTMKIEAVESEYYGVTFSDASEDEDESQEQEIPTKHLKPSSPVERNLASPLLEVERESPIPPKRSPTPEYSRPSGPPTISMGSWGERGPRGNVVVKSDDDYKMAYGQAKSKISEPVTKLARTPSTTLKPRSDIPETPRSTFRAVVEAVAPPKPKPVVSPVKGLSATLNARPVSTDFSENVGTVRSVLSTWKQRLESNENEKRIPQGPPPEIDIYGETPQKPSLINQESLQSSTATTTKHNLLERKLKIVDIGTSASMSTSKEIFNVPSQKSVEVFVQEKKDIAQDKKAETVPLQKKKELSEEKKVEIVPAHETKVEEKKQVSKPLFRMSTMDSQRQQPASFGSDSHKSSDSEKERITLRKAGISLEIPKQDDSSSGTTLKDRKKYFQGIQPVESPNKETPLPAVNMKSSIATIQKVFEQRRKSPSPTPVLQKSMTLPTKPHIQREPAVTIEPQPQLPVTSSTMPRQFSSSMNSAEMVQKLLGRPKSGYDAFRKSPSPISSTTSTLSSQASSGRFSPAEDSNTVRITSEHKKPVVQSNIQNVGNKSIIIVTGSTTAAEEVTPPKGSVSSSIFKVHNSRDEKVANNNKPSLTSTTIVINGHTQPQPEVLKPKKTEEPQPQKIVKNGPSMVPPPPPPPPPNMSEVVVQKRPQNIVLNGRPKSLGSSPSQASTPTSPTDSDPRSEIFNVIKNSNGNFKLKKTGSTFLVK